jgi:N-glycosylase/DNA lyase
MRPHKRTAIRAPDFDLALTMESGQCFRFELTTTKDGTEYHVRNGRRRFTVGQRGDLIYGEGIDERGLRSFFGIDERHGQAIIRLGKDPVLRPIIDRYRGMRVLRQDPHETILAFICSANSNIPKIKQNMTLLARDGTLPRPGERLDLGRARGAKTGYRAQYLIDTNRRLTPRLLERLKRRPYHESHALLCTLPGIGPKVADCVCLYGLGHGEAFPVDVHILRAMKALFPHARIRNEQDAKRFAQQRWSKDAGFAQQLIFQWARDKLRPAQQNKKTGKRRKRAVGKG